jgi:hypothetical protein
MPESRRSSPSSWISTPCLAVDEVTAFPIRVGAALLSIPIANLWYVPYFPSGVSVALRANSVDGFRGSAAAVEQGLVIGARLAEYGSLD